MTPGIAHPLTLSPSHSLPLPLSPSLPLTLSHPLTLSLPLSHSLALSPLAEVALSKPKVAPPPASRPPPKATAPKEPPINLDEVCGVQEGGGKRRCLRSLTCKMHTVKVKMAVQGRSKDFLTLIKLHREALEARSLAAATEGGADKSTGMGALVVGSTTSSDPSASAPKPATVVISRRLGAVKEAATDASKPRVASALVTSKPRTPVSMPQAFRVYNITQTASTYRRTYYAMSLVHMARSKRRKLMESSGTAPPFAIAPAMLFMEGDEPSSSGTIVHAWDKVPAQLQPLREGRIDTVFSEFANLPSTRISAPLYRPGMPARVCWSASSHTT